MIQPVQIVEILPTSVWVESDMMGARHVVLQHEGMEAFTYASFHYEYGYTDNSSTHAAAESLAHALGATDPIEHRPRALEIPTVTTDEIREQIAALHELLAEMEAPR